MNAEPAPPRETTFSEVVTPEAPLEAEMGMWQAAFSAVVLIPMAVALYVGAAPLVVANLLTRRSTSSAIA